MDFFDDAFHVVNDLIEGGDVTTNRALDPGGLTRYGFSQRAHPDLDVMTMTFRDFKDESRKRYWVKAACDRIDHEKGLLIYDAVFQHGISAGSKCVQRAVGAKADGIIGGATLAKIKDKYFDDFLFGVLDQRRRIYLDRNDAVEEANEGGWFNRAVKITYYSTLVFSGTYENAVIRQVVGPK